MEDPILAGVVGLRDAGPSRACDLVVAQLRELIVDGRLAPGSRLPPERDLALRFQTSRATISQALRILSALGLVDIHHGSGVYVAPHPDRLLRHSVELMLGFDRPSLIRLVEARGWMEVAAVARAAEVAGPADVSSIREACELLAAERESVERWLEHDVGFHRAVLVATGNTFVVTLLSPVLELMVSARVVNYRRAGPPAWFGGADLEALVELHRRIADAVAEGDAAAARVVAEEHQLRLVEHVAELDPD